MFKTMTEHFTHVVIFFPFIVKRFEYLQVFWAKDKHLGYQVITSLA